jgi:hypothetical protein
VSIGSQMKLEKIIADGLRPKHLTHTTILQRSESRNNIYICLSCRCGILRTFSPKKKSQHAKASMIRKKLEI